jgi:antitoxin (DNA-binding transcriptional repressor) of toxin-antitoxin stability system
MWEHRQHLGEGTKKSHVRKTTQVSVSHLRQHLPSDLKRVQAGEAIQITSRGHLIARLGAEQDPALEARRWLKSLKSKVELVDVLSPLGPGTTDPGAQPWRARHRRHLNLGAGPVVRTRPLSLA